MAEELENYKNYSKLELIDILLETCRVSENFEEGNESFSTLVAACNIDEKIRAYLESRSTRWCRRILKVSEIMRGEQ